MEDVWMYVYILSRHGLSLVPSGVGQCKGAIKTGKSAMFKMNRKVYSFQQKYEKVHSPTKSVPGEKKVL